MTSGGKKVISPLDHVADSFAQFLKDTKDSPENRLEEFKKSIINSIQESANARAGKEPARALQLAKEAEAEMKSLQDFMTQKSIEEGDFKQIRSTVLMQLADAYKVNSMWEDALHRYQRLLKDREFPHQQMIYLEMGNIAMEQHKYEEAVKHYEMGINHLKTDMNRLMARFNHCCGIAQIHLKEYHKALSSFETALRQDPSIKIGFNLVLCHSILSSPDELRDAFARLVEVRPQMSISEINDRDVLGNHLHIERREQVPLVMLAARLVASRTRRTGKRALSLCMSSSKNQSSPKRPANSRSRTHLRI
jgi:intraflagellar transport protein 88